MYCTSMCAVLMQKNLTGKRMELLISYLLFSLFSFWEAPLALSSTSFSMVIGTLILQYIVLVKCSCKCAYSQVNELIHKQ